MRWLLLSLALVVAGAQSQEGPPKNANKEKSHASKATKKPQTYKQGTSENPLIVKRLDAGETPERRAQMSAERDEKAANERSLVGWTIALAVATVALMV